MRENTTLWRRGGGTGGGPRGGGGRGWGTAGAPEGWAAWLERHGPALVLFARQRLGGRDEGEDGVQEAFVRFSRARPRAADPVAYLSTCVRRTALDWQRTRGRRSRREKLAARPEADPYFAGPAEQD